MTELLVTFAAIGGFLLGTAVTAYISKIFP
jgi:hypothetical protein